MSVSPAGRSPQPKINPRFLPVIDRVLIAGLKLGTAGKREAINKVLQLVPEWKRGDCWRRIRQLRRSLAIAGLPSCSPEKVLQDSEHPRQASRPRSRPWTADDDER